jgi:hypothetical protein
MVLDEIKLYAEARDKKKTTKCSCYRVKVEIKRFG